MMKTMKKLLAKSLVLTTMVGCLAGFAGCHGAKETLEFISGRVQKQREKYFAF